MRRRSFLFGGLLGGALTSIPRVFRKKAVYLSDFGYRPGADNTESLQMAEAAAHLKGLPLVLPKDGVIVLSKPVVLRVSVEGNNTTLISNDSSVFVRLVNKTSHEQIIHGLKYDGGGISNGIFVDETNNVIVNNCHIQNCVDVGIQVYESNGVQLVHNKIDGTPSMIIDTINSKNVISDGNLINGRA